MIEIVQSDIFRQWLDNINARLVQVELGNFGDGVSEMRIRYGPGYRLYFIRRGARVVVLLCGGDKDTQRRDIRRAKGLAAYWRQGNAGTIH